MANLNRIIILPGYAMQIAISQAAPEAALPTPRGVGRDHNLAACIHIGVVHIQLEGAHVALFHKRVAMGWLF